MGKGKWTRRPVKLDLPECIGKLNSSDFVCNTCRFSILCRVEKGEFFNSREISRLDFIKRLKDIGLSSTQITDYGCKAYRCSRGSFGVYMSMFYKDNGQEGT